jgi:acyl-CoA reductase-like NAD-dependent aldehyde dehydrogenase
MSLTKQEAGGAEALVARHGAWIDGRSAAAIGGAVMESMDPATLRPVAEIARCGTEDVDVAVGAARSAQPSWAGRSAIDRARVLSAVGAAVRAELDAFVAAECAETGKPAATARIELEASAAYWEYYAGALQGLHGRTVDHGAAELTYTRREPFGVVAVITPWNGPLNQACRAVAPALAAGNAVVVKPSEFTSTTTLLLAQVATGAGLPDGVLNVVPGTGPEAGEPLARHRDVAKIVFTGSVRTGRVLGAIAAERIVPVTLELGGKSPLIVFGDADLARATGAAAGTMLANAGQICSATTRLLVERGIHDELVEGIVARTASLEPGVHYGPIITAAQYERVLGWFATAAEEGAVLATGGGPCLDDEGAPIGQYVQPTLYTGVRNDMRIAREEIFGPVLVVIPFDDEEEAVAIANDSEYGLGGAVWSGDAARGLRVAARLETGQVAVNGGSLGNDTPFGGYKQSGHGREKGLESLEEYTRLKSVSLRL